MQKQPLQQMSSTLIPRTLPLFFILLAQTTFAAPLNLSKTDGINKGGCVLGDTTIEYTICYDNIANPDQVTNVLITDTLSTQTTFLAANNKGTYNAGPHSVTWDLGTLAGGTMSNCVQLAAKVKGTALPGSVLTNAVTIDSNEQPQTRTETKSAICPIAVSVDIKPGGCPTPINVGSKGVLPVAVLGTSTFDVTTIDPQSITLAGVSPLRWAMEDVATPYTRNETQCNIYDCHELTADGYADMTLKFDSQEIAAAIGEVYDRDCLILALTGTLTAANGGLPIKGGDVISILKKGKKHSTPGQRFLLLKQ